MDILKEHNMRQHLIIVEDLQKLPKIRINNFIHQYQIGNQHMKLKLKVRLRKRGFKVGRQCGLYQEHHTIHNDLISFQNTIIITVLLEVILATYSHIIQQNNHTQ